jgi:hypothetical protein
MILVLKARISLTNLSVVLALAALAGISQTATGSSIVSFNNMTAPTPTSQIPSITTSNPSIITTPNPSVSLGPPLDLSEETTIDDIMTSPTDPTVQQLQSNNPNMNSIVVNYSTTSNIEAEWDEEEQQLEIVINTEPTEEIAETESVEEPTE